ncbi:hypothetical protein EMCRGX_G024663 [Ephydatia muelleri]
MSGQEQAGKGLPGQEKACLGRPVYETMLTTKSVSAPYIVSAPDVPYMKTEEQELYSRRITLFPSHYFIPVAIDHSRRIKLSPLWEVCCPRQPPNSVFSVSHSPSLGRLLPQATTKLSPLCEPLSIIENTVGPDNHQTQSSL